MEPLQSWYECLSGELVRPLQVHIAAQQSQYVWYDFPLRGASQPPGSGAPVFGSKCTRLALFWLSHTLNDGQRLFVSKFRTKKFLSVCRRKVLHGFDLKAASVAGGQIRAGARRLDGTIYHRFARFRDKFLGRR
jgi:hypothetical protein